MTGPRMGKCSAHGTNKCDLCLKHPAPRQTHDEQGDCICPDAESRATHAKLAAMVGAALKLAEEALEELQDHHCDGGCLTDESSDHEPVMLRVNAALDAIRKLSDRG